MKEIITQQSTFTEEKSTFGQKSHETQKGKAHFSLEIVERAEVSLTDIVSTTCSCANNVASLKGEDMKSSKPRLQKIEDFRYIVRLGTLRLGEVAQNDGKWFYLGRIGISKIGYDTKEQAADELVARTTKRVKKPSDYPRIHFRLARERILWFREYAKRKGKSMSGIIKEYIEQLYQEDHSN